jgi:hypothetical protein
VCRRDIEQTEWNVWTLYEYDCVLFYTHKEFLYSDVNESTIMYYIYKLLLGVIIS